ncbi:terpene synthase family protein [Nocardia thraciensis]
MASRARIWGNGRDLCLPGGNPDGLLLHAQFASLYLISDDHFSNMLGDRVDNNELFRFVTRATEILTGDAYRDDTDNPTLGLLELFWHHAPGLFGHDINQLHLALMQYLHAQVWESEYITRGTPQPGHLSPLRRYLPISVIIALERMLRGIDDPSQHPAIQQLTDHACDYITIVNDLYSDGKGADDQVMNCLIVLQEFEGLSPLESLGRAMRMARHHVTSFIALRELLPHIGLGTATRRYANLLEELRANSVLLVKTLPRYIQGQGTSIQ